MKSLLHLLFFLPLTLIGCAPKSTDFDGALNRNNIDKILSNPHRQSRQASGDHRFNEINRAFRIEKEADVVVAYNGETLSIYRSRPTQPDDYRKPSQLIPFFDSQPRKKLVVVVFDKNVWSDSRLRSEITKTNRYFFARGYHRVVIQQASGGIHRLTHSDSRAPLAGSGN